jgi:hypothetical protein
MAEVRGWAEREVGGAALYDARRRRRYVDLVQALARQPDAALPQAAGSSARLQAAQRFLTNPAIRPDALLAPHVAATAGRMAAYPVVLAVQDTTELDLSHFPTMAGTGPLSSLQQRGLLVHTTLAVAPPTDDRPRLPLGLLDQQVWARDPATFGRLSDHKARPIAAKESHKWLAGSAAVHELVRGGQVPPATTVVIVADRESDVYDVLAQARPPTVHLLVRAAYDRAVADAEGQAYLWDVAAAAPRLATVAVMLPARAGRPARTARLDVRATAVTLRPPRHRTAEHLAPVPLWVVWAHEPRPPAGQEPVRWLLLTSWPVADAAAALTVVRWYTARWEIEVWHRTLKSGCRIEARRFDAVTSFVRGLTLYSIVAWRVLYAAMLARADPEAPCTAVLEPDEWQALWVATAGTPDLPATPPPLGAALTQLARQGGYQPRSRRPFGPTTLWRGFAWLAGATAVYRVLRSHPDLLHPGLPPPDSL